MRGLPQHKDTDGAEAVYELNGPAVRNRQIHNKHSEGGAGGAGRVPPTVGGRAVQQSGQLLQAQGQQQPDQKSQRLVGESRRSRSGRRGHPGLHPRHGHSPRPLHYIHITLQNPSQYFRSAYQKTTSRVQ